ncbi:MAG: CRISPR-associated protein Csm3 [Bacillota bacterium]|jgi:CRISPR-associated protein Csm3|nr:CRISPR-associated protein Csm3 [Bacillota bacterium]
MKLIRHREITGIIHCKTGLRIGGSRETLEIGGIDAPIIRHPITELPYIPGSSLKGKMRSLLEQATGNVSDNGSPHNCGRCPVCVNFGSLKSESSTRFLFRDAPLTAESEEKLRRAQEEKGLNFSELKTEVVINRKTGRADRVGPRTFERVPEGTEFAFSMTVRVFEGDDEQKMLDLLRQGFELLEKDYLGSSGSRGYGQIEFRDLKIDGQPLR